MPDTDRDDLTPMEERVLRLTAEWLPITEVAARSGWTVAEVAYCRDAVADRLGLRGRVGIYEYAVSRGWVTATSRSAAA